MHGRRFTVFLQCHTLENTMIENLNGIFETVNYKQGTSLKLYNNDEYEDYPAHWHVALEIIMPTENVYTVEIPDRKVVLREGDIAFICPGCVHTLYAPEVGKRIIFQPDVASLRFMPDVEAMLTILSPMTVFTPEEHPTIHGALKELMLGIRDEYLSGNSFYEVKLYADFLDMLSTIGKGYSYSKDKELSDSRGRKEEYIEKFIYICNYIGEHCAEELTLEDIAEMSGFSKFYFSRLFKQFTGVTFLKYVNQKRIALAETLLTEPRNSITDVAVSCGFSSLSAFIRMFKIIKGCTPTEFRNMYTT